MANNVIKKIAVLTSGGDAPGMNCAIRSVVRFASFKNISVVGVGYGYKGLIERDFRILGPRDVSNIISRGGTILKTARSKEFLDKVNRAKVYNNLTQEGVDALVSIGGNGSFKGLLCLNQEFNLPVVGIPGTIDNDIKGTQRTLGFDTALNTAMDAIDKIKDTATSMDRIFLIEVMGRDSGSIAVYSALAGGAEDIIIPGADVEDDLAEKIREGREKGKKSWIVIVAEGAGSVDDLAKKLSSVISDIRITVIGHTQRGGAPSAFDRFLGALMGKEAVTALLRGESSSAIGWVDDKAISYPLKEAISKKSEDFRYLQELIHILT
ncbi:MAG: ATP-dependent 6-phosphofructokinase [Candidatus Kaelpia aquatica]|nr:ATP-dependent 6-phosphofructokinase [Candidatus Kaelpia aquatica]